jgi:hypothetical protein
VQPEINTPHGNNWQNYWKQAFKALLFLLHCNIVWSKELTMSPNDYYEREQYLRKVTLKDYIQKQLQIIRHT